MIEKMKKLSLLIYHASKDRFLYELQQLGVVHLEANKSIQNEDIIRLNNKISKTKKAEILLRSLNKENKQKIKQIKYKGKIQDLLNIIEQENEKLNILNSDMDTIKKEIALLTPWGNFNPENIEKLSEAGINFNFYSTSEKKYYTMDKKNLNVEIINNIKGTVYFTVIFTNEENIEINDAAEQKVPIKNLKNLFKESSKLREKIDKQKQIVAGFSRYSDQLNNDILTNTNELEYYIADANLSEKAEGKILLIHGWVPIKLLKKVESFLKNQDAVHLLEDPKPEDNVPVMLKNKKFSSLFEPITKIYSLPGYTEIDPTPFFAPFFMLFFGLCFADLGYGIISLVALIIALFVIKSKKTRKLLYLGILFSISTIISGIILDTFFGTNLTKLQFLPNVLKEIILFPTEAGTNGPMIFAIILGIVQVFVGISIQTANCIRNNGFKAGLEPIGKALTLIGSTFSVMVVMGKKELSIGPKLPLGKLLFSMPADPLKVFITIGIIGVLLILFFNNIDKKIYIRPLTFLWEFYNVASGFLGDILSYIRLFALGLAGGLLGGAFNQIAFMARDGLPFIVNYFAMVLILLFGHTLNFGLAALGAFVHPLRLTFVEFYKAVNFKGGGEKYSPFKHINDKN